MLPPSSKSSRAGAEPESEQETRRRPRDCHLPTVMRRILIARQSAAARVFVGSRVLWSPGTRVPQVPRVPEEANRTADVKVGRWEPRTDSGQTGLAP